MSTHGVGSVKIHAWRSGRRTLCGLNVDDVKTVPWIKFMPLRVEVDCAVCLRSARGYKYKMKDMRLFR